METEKRLELLRKNTEEIVTEQELRETLGRKTQTAYIGYAPTGRLHIGYFIPIVKIKDFLDAGIRMTFLVADLHAHLDDLKTPWELLEARSKYYEEGVKAMLTAVGADTGKIRFVKGTSFQYGKKYVEEMMRLAANVTMSRSRRAAAEVVRFGEEPKVGGFIYPIMQALDVAALDADIALGGIDQRGPYMLAREILPIVGHKKPVCIFTPLLPGLTGEKMSASVPQSKIDVLDTEEEVRLKMAKAFCPAGKAEGNGVLAFIRLVLMRGGREFVVERDKKWGGNLAYRNYSELEKDYVGGKVHPADLKASAAREINKLLAPVRKSLKKGLVDKAYPKT